jgi:hypothetical protein
MSVSKAATPYVSFGSHTPVLTKSASGSDAPMVVDSLVKVNFIDEEVIWGWAGSPEQRFSR